MYVVYSNPIGAGLHERIEFTSYALAREVFEQACTPVLTIEAYLLYVGPNPLFPARTMTTIERQWHR